MFGGHDVLRLDNLEIAYKKWDLRLEQLLSEDSNENNLNEYKDKWKDINKEYIKAKSLIVKTISNIKKSPRVEQQYLGQNDQSPNNRPIKPISELKPLTISHAESSGFMLSIIPYVHVTASSLIS